MSKKVDNSEEVNGSVHSDDGATQHEALQVDDLRVQPLYANFFRIHSMPEEVILDFGISLPPTEGTPRPITVQQRVAMNFYSAKRMLHALQLTIQRYEATFGPLETDIQKRVRPGAPGQSR